MEEQQKKRDDRELEKLNKKIAANKHKFKPIIKDEL